jgi:hypothetical protein
MKSERNERQMKRHREIKESTGREAERERDGEATCATGTVHFPGQVGNTS